MNPHFQQRILRAACWGLPAVLALWAALAAPEPVRRLDLLAFDLFSAAAPRLPAGDPGAPVVVAIDERSLAALGRWPWPRRLHARLVEQIGQAGARVIAYSVLFDAADARDPEGDESFVQAVEDSGRVILPVAPVQSDSGEGVSALVPFAPFGRAAAGLAHVDVDVDADAVVRRLFLGAGTDGRHWPALSYAALSMYEPAATLTPPGLSRLSGSGGSAGTWHRNFAILLESARIPEIARVSAADVLAGEPAGRALLAGRAVFVGVTAAGVDAALGLAKPGTGRLVPAVVVHAEAFEALRGAAVATPMGREEVVLLSLVVLLAGFLLNRAAESRIPQLGLGVMLLPALCAALMLYVSGIWFPPAAATLALAASSLTALVLSYIGVRAERARLGTQTRVALDAVADGVLTIDLEGGIEKANAVAAALLGKSEPELRGLAVDSIFASNSGVQQALRRCLEERRGIRVAEPVCLGQAQKRVLKVMIGPILGPRGIPEGAVLALSDVTESVVASERLAHQATHDALTGLPNRVLIRDRLERAVGQVRRAGGSVAVLFVDLDRFKRINDGLGHQTGDLVLTGISGRLQAICRATDTIGRWGGDEFIVVLTDPQSASRADLVAQKILGVITEPLVLDSKIFHLGASIGISIAPDDSSEPDALLEMADMAMYQVKLAGGGSFAHSSPDISARSKERVDVETGLRDALSRGELVLHYQPQFDLRTGRISGMEALLRWQRPGYGLVSPAHFIPVAEESNLIFTLGAWVLDEAARQLREWMDCGCCPVTVSANVSARQCLDSGLVGVVAEVIARHSIPPPLLELEITETAAVGDVEHVAGLLAQLRQMGVRVALDDFGTGYSSLSHLKRLSIGTLKIDRSFVSGAPAEEGDAAISRATIALAHNLGMRVVAEGVETEAQRAFLAREGCDVGQGFLFSRPLAASAVPPLLPPGLYPGSYASYPVSQNIH